MNAPLSTSRPRVVLVAAVARNGVIGKDNQLLWHIPEDMAHFRSFTRACAVVMGRKTWDSLPPRFRPLPQRRNVVITRHSNWQAEGAEVVQSWPEALALLAGEPRVCVIGGSQIYQLALPDADELMLTEIDRDFEGDAQFPIWSPADFPHRHAEPLVCGQDPGFSVTLANYSR
jgi:dihydrofolate reductase